MFLKKTIEKNPKLIKAAFDLYDKLEPNTYILDLDAIKENASLIALAAKEKEIVLYQMTKQFGRNPLVAKEIGKCGIPKVVAVDPWEALLMIDNNIPLGNVGHLVQIPKNLVEKIVKAKPDVITVFTIEKLKEISNVAIKNNMIQNIIIKIVGEDDVIYPAQEGGVKISHLHNFINESKILKGIKIIGVTSFPCFLTKANKIVKTSNIDTLHKAQDIAKKIGVEFTHINMPSTNCVASIPLLAKEGATHGEPGHALTGTTPSHIIDNKHEKPSIVYISEISHTYNKTGYFYGGGHYRRSNINNVLIGDKVNNNFFKVKPLDNTVIDYYLGVEINKIIPKVGEVVVAAFRAQIFTTRAKVAVVSGIQSSNPKIEGIFNSQGVKYGK